MICLVSQGGRMPSTQQVGLELNEVRPVSRYRLHPAALGA
jgi:hypothetical protein